ncbi:MAG: Uncharacterized protein XD85_0259 [Parcubacteria bacterium 34_609]|nr:MAG: Uncharacterized protein XD85_0259 [Parcubacteria bacterium 34_609]KUK98834.1 MAG: Uncharacterized protein XE08_0382 [Parcubacteria bacterium 32_520]
MRKYFYLVLLSFLLVWMVGCVPDNNIPIVNTISPLTGQRGQTLDVTITGAYFSGATYINIGSTDVHINSFEVVSSTEILANITIYGTAQLGPKDVIVTTPNGTGTGVKLFTVSGMPSITSISPSSGVQGALVDVTILGEGFYGVTGVSFGSGITIENFQVFSEYVPTMMIVSINISETASLGVRNVTINTTHGIATGSGLFTVTAASTAPVVSSVNPAFGMIGQTLSVSIKGSNFNSNPESISFGSGITVNSFTLISSGEIQANISISSGATLGDRDVSVTIGGLTGVGEDLFNVYTLI